MTDATEPLEIRTTRANDWTWTVIGSLFFLMAGYALVVSSDADWHNAQGIRGEGIYLLFEGLVGASGVRIVVAGLGLVFGLNALGAAWRLIDGRVALRADTQGLIFHPSFYNAALNWNDVESVNIGGRRPARIIIRLKRRFWSLTHPFSGRDVQLNIIAIGSSYRSAETAVRKMRHWQES